MTTDQSSSNRSRPNPIPAAGSVQSDSASLTPVYSDDNPRRQPAPADNANGRHDYDASGAATIVFVAGLRCEYAYSNTRIGVFIRTASCENGPSLAKLRADGTPWKACRYQYDDHRVVKWPNRDPIEESSDSNLYRFAGNSPVDSIDPDGRYVITGTCDATQKRQIEASIKASCQKAKECGSRCPSGTPSLAVSEICDNPKASTPVINCTKTKAGKPCTVCGYSTVGSGVINLCPKTFDRTQQDGFGCKRDCVIFHEANHAKKDVGLEHGIDMSNFDTCMGCPR